MLGIDFNGNKYLLAPFFPVKKLQLKSQEGQYKLKY